MPRTQIDGDGYAQGDGDGDGDGEDDNDDNDDDDGDGEDDDDGGDDDDDEDDDEVERGSVAPLLTGGQPDSGWQAFTPTRQSRPSAAGSRRACTAGPALLRSRPLATQCLCSSRAIRTGGLSARFVAGRA